MSRFDKYGPFVGGFRAPLNFALTAATDIPAGVAKIYAVSVNASGRVVKGPAITAVQGLVIPVRPMAVGEPIDVMTAGEIADATTTAGAAFTAGSLVYAHADGTVDGVATAGVIVGKCVEPGRIIVRCPVPTTAL